MNTTPPTSSPPSPSLVGRLFRWLFSWRTLRRGLLTLAGLVTLAALFFAEENWRGKRDWEQFKREWEAKGEQFDLASFGSQPVPDDQNFLMASYLAPLFREARNGATEERKKGKGTTDAPTLTPQVDIWGGTSDLPLFGNIESGTLTDLRKWQEYYRGNTNFASPPKAGDAAQDVLFALGKFEPVLKELRDATLRPHVVFPALTDGNLTRMFSYFSTVKGLTVALRLHATANLEAGRSDEALQDVKLSFRLSETLNSEPLLISHLVRIATLHISLCSVWEGLARHRWTEPQLVELQRLLSSNDAFADYSHAMRGERAFGNSFYEKMLRGESFGQEATEASPEARLMRAPLFPRGWFYQNQLCGNRLIQTRLLEFVDAHQHRAFPERAKAMEEAPELKRTTPYNILVRMTAPAIAKGASKSARIQANLDLAWIACAIERFRIANNRYPNQLQALVPQYAERLPADVVNGEPLKYRLGADGGYVLYSVGWNLKDDGGISKPKPVKGAQVDPDAGDWVWICPTH